MLTVTLLVCAMMALTRANDVENTSTNVTVSIEDGSTNVTMAAEDTLKGNPSLRFAANMEKCAAGWTMYNGRCFKFVPAQMTWAQAQANCQKEKGNLASIHSDDEHVFIKGLMTNLLPTWIGGSDCQEGGAWFWIDGASMDYKPWCPQQPDSTLDQCCLQMNTGGNKCWDDQPCGHFLPSVCVIG